MSNERKSAPSFVPLLNAALLYAFLTGFGAASSLVLPILGEIWEKSPRLGALAFLAYLASPIGLIAIAHHLGHGFLDRFDARKRAREKSFLPDAESLSAGFFGWFAIVFSSVASAFVLLAMFPPPKEESTMAALVSVATDVRLQATLHTAVWILIAAGLYAAERKGRRSSAD
jgi:hypothetical protein